jgi:Putative polyhydroxyalkanoic acid system protein (PHA_gran_rgn)
MTASHPLQKLYHPRRNNETHMKLLRQPLPRKALGQLTAKFCNPRLEIICRQPREQKRALIKRIKRNSLANERFNRLNRRTALRRKMLDHAASKIFNTISRARSNEPMPSCNNRCARPLASAGATPELMRAAFMTASIAACNSGLARFAPDCSSRGAAGPRGFCGGQEIAAREAAVNLAVAELSSPSAASAATAGDKIEPFLSVVKHYTHIPRTGSFTGERSKGVSPRRLVSCLITEARGWCYGYLKPANRAEKRDRRSARLRRIFLFSACRAIRRPFSDAAWLGGSYFRTSFDPTDQSVRSNGPVRMNGSVGIQPHGSWQPERKCLHGGHRRIVMSNSIVITVPHRLGAKEAKRRIAEQIELLRRNYIDKLAYSEANWNGDTANLRVVAFGQTATAQVYVLDDALRIEVQLPWILAALTGKIQGILKSNAEESLRIGHTPPKA